MKLKHLSLCLLLASATASAELIQHTDQIAEVRFNGSSYELGRHVGTVAKDQIIDAIDRFDSTLNVMLPGLNTKGISKGFKTKSVFEKLEKSSPDAADYIRGLSESLQRSPELLLSVAMSDEAILESQAQGGMGFLQAEHDPNAPAKCTVMAKTDQKGHAWGAANFDYMGVNYTGLIVLKHTDENGQTRVIQTWAGLIPYGGIAKGGQMVLMNTNASDGTAREKDGGVIITNDSTPSMYLSWEAYNIQQPSDIVKMVKKHKNYSAYFSYTVADGNSEVVNVENGYKNAVRTSTAPWKAHANHSIYQQDSFVDDKFAAHSLARQAAADKFMANDDISMGDAQDFLGSKPLWKGRGKMMGTVTSTYFDWTPAKTTMYIQTDKAGRGAPVVIINNTPVRN